MMTPIKRRHFFGAATLLLAAPMLSCISDNIALAQQILHKPEVKLSQAKPLVVQHVDNMSLVMKEHFGSELTSKQKDEMVDAILSNMKEQGTYEFVDP